MLLLSAVVLLIVVGTVLASGGGSRSSARGSRRATTTGVPRHPVSLVAGNASNPESPTMRRDKTPLLASSAPYSPTCPACRPA
jgi:hypothetical protein